MKTETVERTKLQGNCELVIVDNSKRFEDVPPGTWFSDAVTFVTAREIFNGDGAGLFAPDGTMTRGMIAQVLFNFDRNAKATNAAVFKDAAGKWYSDAASWAADIGAVQGTGDGFDGEADVTREQLATILYRYAAASGGDTSFLAGLEQFADADQVSAYARDAMGWAVSVGLVHGTVSGLEPQGKATRAQVAAILERFCENVIQ